MPDDQTSLVAGSTSLPPVADAAAPADAGFAQPADSPAPMPDVVPEPVFPDPVPVVGTGTTQSGASDVPVASDATAGPVDTNPASSAAPSVPTDSIPTDSAIVEPLMPTQIEREPESSNVEIYSEVAGKIANSHNVLIALSSDPSVDEMAAAIGLSLYLDKLGKRTTAIYSGATPNALEFLKPEETFEPSADTLQDFVIALNKEKADHLRYKLDGDFVKIYITPYHSKITADDLEFSYGDYNVDLVLALDVANGIDLDSALREHGRIMHDAVIINITTGNPGKFGEIEWSDKKASSVSEMIAKLLYAAKSDVSVGKEEATAFLTGIVAATNRFSNAATTPETMTISSKLMVSGANQQLISKNITPDIDNELHTVFSAGGLSESGASNPNDPTRLDIKHGDNDNVNEAKEVNEAVNEKDSSLLDDLKAAEASLSQAGTETTPDLDEKPIDLNSQPGEEKEEPTESAESAAEPAPEPASEDVSVPAPEEPAEPESSAPTEEAPTPDNSSVSGFLGEDSPSGAEEKNEVNDEGIISEKPEKVIAPSDGFTGEPREEDNKYGKMLEEAISDLSNPANIGGLEPNPATMSAPGVVSQPEINGVPEMNYMPMPDDGVLPPPPTPPIDMSGGIPPMSDAAATEPIQPAVPPVQPEPVPIGDQPVMQDQVYNDPSAFKIPGM